MCVVIKSRPEFKMGHVESKTRSLGQFLEKKRVLSRRHSFDPVFMKLCQNDFLTLNKHLSRGAMLSDDSSCSALETSHSLACTFYEFVKVCRCFYATNENIHVLSMKFPHLFLRPEIIITFLWGWEWSGGQVRHRSPRNSGFFRVFQFSPTSD